MTKVTDGAGFVSVVEFPRIFAGGASAMVIPEAVERKLNAIQWRRPEADEIEIVLSEFGVANSDFAQFFRKYRGPFASDAVGYELLDLVEDDESIASNTKLARAELGFPERYLILTAMLGHAVLVYDSTTGRVFDVDFEGGDGLLKAERLSPRWTTWSDFLGDYFV